MIKHALLTVYLIFTFTICFGQQQPDYAIQIDSLINAQQKGVFSGIVLIAQGDKPVYTRVQGFADLHYQPTLTADNQFVIGSISKQFTAVLTLREFDKGRLELFAPIRTYLPNLPQSWADTVTVHHLLTHTHGITELDKPLTFKAGSQYNYSQIGYDLLAQIVEQTSHKSFAQLSTEMFESCGMTNTYHPNNKQYTQLVTGYTILANGALIKEPVNESLRNYAAAGSFISTAADLLQWNKCFYDGQLLSEKAITLLTTKQDGAVRNHPVFGQTTYGYGITVDTKDGILQYGQTGFAPGFISMNFYFPETKTSVIVLKNIAYNPDDLKESFYYHTKILDAIRKSNLSKTQDL